MLDEYEEKRRKQVSRMRSIMDYTMGIVFLAIGIAFLVSQFTHKAFLGREPSTINYFLGALFLLYGTWRIYRGYKKNYFRPE